MPRFRPRPLRFFQDDRAMVALLVLIFLGANWPLLAGHVSEQLDGEFFFAPYYNYLASLTRAGHFLGWDPFCSGGTPDFAEPQLGGFSPVTLLFALVGGPTPFGFHLYWLFVWLLGGLGMYVLARVLSAPPWGALVTALAVVFSGFYIGHSEHISTMYTFSFMPWVLWRVRVALTTGRRWPACEAGALWGLAALAGHPSVHIPGAMFVGVVALAWLPPVAVGGSPWARWRGYALTMTLLAGVGVLVLAPGYLSFYYEAAGYSHRSLPLPREFVLGQKFGWSWLTGIATPAFVPLNGVPDWSEFDISLREIYFGAAVPVFALLTVWRWRARWQTWLIFGTGLLYLGVSLGGLLPLRTWLYDLLPPTRYFRHAPMFRGFFILAMAMLAAPGTALVEASRKEGSGRRPARWLAIVSGTCAVVGVISYAWVSAALPDDVTAKVSAAAPYHAAFAWIGLAALCVTAARRPDFIRFMPCALVVLTALDLTGAFFITRYRVYSDKTSVVAAGPVQPLADLGTGGFARTVAAMNNTNLYDRRPVFVSYTSMRNYIQEHWGLDRLLRPYVLGPQRVWFAADVPTVPPTIPAYEAFVRRAHEVGAMPVVRHERADLIHLGDGVTPEAVAAIDRAPLAQGLDCRVVTYHDNDLSLRVTCPADGFLLLTDRWARSWQATVDGQPTPVDGGDFLFRLVRVHAGENLVAMRYDVSWVYALVALSWGTLVVVAGGALWTLRRARETVSVDFSDQEPLPLAATV